MGYKEVDRMMIEGAKKVEEPGPAYYIITGSKSRGPLTTEPMQGNESAVRASVDPLNIGKNK